MSISTTKMHATRLEMTVLGRTLLDHVNVVSRHRDLSFWLEVAPDHMLRLFSKSTFQKLFKFLQTMWVIGQAEFAEGKML